MQKLRTDSHPKHEARRTGRTTRMVLRALKAAYDGNNVVIVCHEPRFSAYLIDVIRKIVTEYRAEEHMEIIKPPFKPIRGNGLEFEEQKANSSIDWTVRFGPGQVSFMSIDSPSILLHPLHVDGVDPRCVFWDHEAIRRAFNQQIEEYHRYDS